MYLLVKGTIIVINTAARVQPDNGAMDDGYQKGLALLVYKFCDKKSSGRAIKHEGMSDKELAE